MDGAHFGDKKVYDYYAKSAAIMRDRGRESVSELFTNSQVHGTPEQILTKLRRIDQLTGPMNLNVCFSFGGMPFDSAESSMGLFAEQVLPELHRWSCDPVQNQASA